MKLWSKGFSTADVVEKFTVGKDRELDLLLAKYDVQGSLAHTKMLNQQGFISDQELKDIETELAKISTLIKEGDFIIEDGIEDVHSQIEMMLTKAIGDAGKKIHTGRSRNDQVLVDLMLYMRAEVIELTKLIDDLFQQLIALSEEHKDKLMPGYTHMQIAMPSSFGMWFAAYAESLIDDVFIFEAAHKIVNQNPLGSAAGYGSSFPLDRKLTTSILKFDSLKFNSVAAQQSRGKAEKSVAFAMSAVSGTIGKLAMDICLYMGQNFGFITFPKELTTGSSIMPHKKNPDVFELIRARCNQVQSLPMELAMITSNLPSGYHRDFQQVKEIFFPSIASLKEVIEMCTFMLKNIIVNVDFIDEPKYNYLYTVEDVNKEVIAGLPFRDAYKKVGKTVEEGTYQPSKDINHTHEGSIGNLCNDEIRAKMKAALSFLNIS